MNSTVVNHISECFVKPKYEVEESKQPFYLTPWDLTMLSMHYIQKGLLFTKPSRPNEDQDDSCIHKLLEHLKDSLSLTLVHFYPLAGRLVTRVDEARHECLVFVDCTLGPGARFIHASSDMTIFDILSPTDVPLVVRELFDHDRAVNHDGHTRPLLSVQVTELLDGIFIGCSMNHVLVDGTSYWRFWNVWSEIHGGIREQVSGSRPSISKRWYPDGSGPAIPLPFTNPDEFVCRYEAPQLRERVFCFSPESMAKLKAKANEESNTNNISSFQALSALVWRSVVRATHLLHDQVTNCRLLANNRQRLDPHLPQDYFGNSISAITTTTTAGELCEHSLGWAALLLHQSVVNHSDKALRDIMKKWLQSPSIVRHQMLSDSNTVAIGSSPRFDMYRNEFELGKALAVRSGYADKFVGKVICYPGFEGKGSVDLEICLLPESMKALELDGEFMAAVSFSNTRHAVPLKAMTCC